MNALSQPLNPALAIIELALASESYRTSEPCRKLIAGQCLIRS